MKLRVLGRFFLIVVGVCFSACSQFSPYLGSPPLVCLNDDIAKMVNDTKASDANKKEREKEGQFIQVMNFDGIEDDSSSVYERCIKETKNPRLIRWTVDLILLEETDGKDSQCIYKCILMNQASIARRFKDPSVRRATVSKLEEVAHYNCESFWARAFANRTGISFWQKLTSGGTTTGAAATAAGGAAPAVPAGLAAASLLLDRTGDSIDSNYYQGGTVAAMRIALAGKLDDMDQEIAKKNNDTYALYDALRDYDAYARTCSIQGGLVSLTELAAKSKEAKKAGEEAVMTTAVQRLRTAQDSLISAERLLEEKRKILEEANASGDQQRKSNAKKDLEAAEAQKKVAQLAVDAAKEEVVAVARVISQSGPSVAPGLTKQSATPGTPTGGSPTAGSPSAGTPTGGNVPTTGTSIP